MLLRRGSSFILSCHCYVESKVHCFHKAYVKSFNRLIFTSSVNKIKKISAAEAMKIKNDNNFDEEQNYADTFGNLNSFEIKFGRIKEDKEDVEEYKRLRASQGKTVKQYIEEVKQHLERNDYKKAIHVLEVDMINDSKPAIPYIYKLLLVYNAKTGDLKECLRLYFQFKERQGKVKGGMYTSMFNACANCKNSFYALNKATLIRKHITEDKYHSTNLTNYNAMLKAFGRHGDFSTCLNIVDEVLEKRDKVRICTFRFLLQACISDKNTGLRYGLITWRKMLSYRLKPEIFDFNLLLRCIRDCNFGENELINDLINQIISESELFYVKKVRILKKNNVTHRVVENIPVPKEIAIKSFQIESKSKKNESSGLDRKTNDHKYIESSSQLLSSENSTMDQGSSDNLTLDSENLKDINYLSYSKSSKEVPNLISLVPSKGLVTSFTNLIEPYEKFMCFGGLKGFLNTMSEFGVKPDAKTFTLILSIVFPTVEAEERVINEAQAHGVKLDTAFFNVLIKRRNQRKETYSIENALKEMQKAGASPDIITFGVLALGCSTLEKGIELMNYARNSGIRLNSEILGALLHQATISSDLQYVKSIIEAAKEDETELSPKFIALLNKFVSIEKSKRKIADKNLMNEDKNLLNA